MSSESKLFKNSKHKDARTICILKTQNSIDIHSIDTQTGTKFQTSKMFFHSKTSPSFTQLKLRLVSFVSTKQNLNETCVRFSHESAQLSITYIVHTTYS